MAGPDTTDKLLARWLQEVGRRRVVRASPPVAEAPAAAAVPDPVASIRKSPRRLRALILLAVAAIAFMPYFFADVHLQIYGLQHLISFAWAGGG